MPLLFNRVLEVLTREIKQGKGNERHSDIFSERRNNTNLTVDDTIVCV